MTLPDAPDWATTATFKDNPRLLVNVVNLNTAFYASPILDVSRFQSVIVRTQWGAAGALAASELDFQWASGGFNLYLDSFTQWNNAGPLGNTNQPVFCIPCMGDTLAIGSGRPAAGDLLTLTAFGSGRALSAAKVTGSFGALNTLGVPSQSLAAAASLNVPFGPTVSKVDGRFSVVGAQPVSFTINGTQDNPISFIPAFTALLNNNVLDVRDIPVQRMAGLLTITNNGAAPVTVQAMLNAEV